MKNTWKSLTILLAVSLFGCAAKKERYKETTSYKTDTLVLRTETIKAPILTSSIVIEQLCDSLGNLRPFKQTLTRGRDTIYLTSENGGLRLDIDLDSISQSAVDKFKSSDSFKTLTEISNTVKWKWSKWTWIFLVWAILATIFVFISPRKLFKLITGI